MKTMNIKNRSNKSGFTLVELSIVIVIIGFLIAGIAAGTNLIKQASLRSVIADYQSYISAYNGFFDQNRAVPGDMSTAFAIWGTNCADTATDCNGNGNGLIDYVSGSATSEVNRAWIHLSQAGFVNTGVIAATAANLTSTNIGTNAPSSKIASAGYIMVVGGGSTVAPTPTAAPGVPFDVSKNTVWIGKVKASDTLLASALLPKDAFSIDQKMDDGVINSSNQFVGAMTGSVRAHDGSDVSANTCVDVSANNYQYVVGTTAISCRLGATMN